MYQFIMTISNLIRIYVPYWNLSLTTWRYVYKWFQIWRRPNSPWQLQFIFPRPWWWFLCMRLICVFAWAAIFSYQYLICLLQRWNYSNLYVFWGDQNMVCNLWYMIFTTAKHSSIYNNNVLSYGILIYDLSTCGNKWGAVFVISHS